MHEQQNKLITGNDIEPERGKEMRKIRARSALGRSELAAHGGPEAAAAEKGGKELKRTLTQTRSIKRRKRISEKGTDRLNLIKGEFRSNSFKNVETPVSTPIDPRPRSPFEFVDLLHHHHHYPDETPRSMSRFEELSLDDPAEMMSSATSPTMEERPISHPPSPTTQTQSHSTPTVTHNQTQKQMRSCIKSSIKTRALSSVIIAILVVLSHIFNPLSEHTLSSHIITALRPIHTVLLTDVTILLAELLLEKERVLEEPPGGDVLAGSVGFQAIQALVVDCGIYLVFVVCGLFLV